MDLDGDQKIEKEELLKVCSMVSKILQKNYPKSVNSQMTPQEVVDRIFNQQMDNEKDIIIQNMINEEDEDQKKDIFEKYEYLVDKIKKSTEKNFLKEALHQKGEELKKDLIDLEKKIKGKKDVTVGDLSYDEFKDRAVHESDFLTCFGLFTLFHAEVVKPIEKQFDIHKYKLGYPSVEGRVTVTNFVEKKPYVQVLNGFMNIFSSYKHCRMNQDVRWEMHQKDFQKTDFTKEDEMSKTVIKQLKDLEIERAMSIGIKNSTFEDQLTNLKTDLYHGFKVKAPEDNLSKGSFTTCLYGQGSLVGVSGLMSYEIGTSGYSLFILFEVGFLISTAAVAISVEESTINRNVAYTKLKLKTKSSGILDIKSELYQVRACIGNPVKKEFLSHKISLLIEITESQECPPPLCVIDLTEANLRRSKKNDDSFFMSTPLFKETEFILDNESLLDPWMSTIQRNQTVAQLDHPSQSFSPFRPDQGARFFITGSEYYDDLKERLKEARTEILITGWFISPQLHLSRKKINGKYPDRLDEILLERAHHGVMIYILVWDEIDAAFKLGSKQIKEVMKHPNINVIRDPLDLLGIWSHHQKTCVIDQTIGYCGGIDIAYNRYDTTEYKLTDEGEDPIYPGRDYVNPMVAKENAYLGDPYVNVWDRSKEPRMPWQDLQMKIVGEGARDLARNFIQRWNRSRNSDLPYLTLRSHDYNKSDLIQKLKQQEPYPKCNIQVIRSASYWSMGLNTVESSIYQSEIEAIRKSKHFIYIENQFFVSSHTDGQVNPENKLLKAFCERIERAIINKEKFRFIFVTPIHSSSPMKNTTVQKLTYWQFTSMFKGKKSLYGYFKEKYPDVNIDDYMTISCLRQYGQFKSGVYSTEMIYVHSKLMIVDDRIVFISSANVNDRSMLGDRDSEIGARVEDSEEIEITMGGEKFMANKFAHQLRHRLQCIFTGADETLAKEAIDPVLFYDKWMEISKNNQKIFIEVFQMIEENIRSPNDVFYLTEYNHKLLARNTDKLKELKGFVVPYPKSLFMDSYVEPSEIDPTAKFYC